MFEVDTLIEACRRAITETEPRLAIKEVLGGVLTTPDDVADRLASKTGGITLLHQSDDLTVLNVIWAPGMSLYPHDHRMWAAIGIYGGQEDNTFYRRSDSGLTASGGKQLRVGDIALLGDDTIHAVANPTMRFTGAIHVYGGDFVNQPRSQWDAVTLEESPYDIEDTHRAFARANAEVAASR